MQNFNLLEQFISLADVEDGKFYQSYSEILDDSLGRISIDKKLPLTSLEGCPKIINGEFYLINTMLTSLKYGPEVVKGPFNVSQCDITSLKYGPHIVEGSYQIGDTKLTSLQYCPSIINGIFYCNNTDITSLEYAPLVVKKYCDVSQNNIKSLEGIGRRFFREIGKELALPNSIESNILGLCKINKLERIPIYNKIRYIQSGHLYEALEIIQEYLQTDGDECMEELIQNGYNKYAKF